MDVVVVKLCLHSRLDEVTEHLMLRKQVEMFIFSSYLNYMLSD